MVAQTSAPMGDPDKIMGLPKPVFWIIIAVGAIFAFYIFKKSSSSNSGYAVMGAGDQPNPDWLQDQNSQGSGGGSAGLNAAGLPNVPGTNANPNPEPVSDPTSQSGTPTMTDTPTSTYTNPYTSYAPYYPSSPTSGLGSGGAYQTGPAQPSPGGAITGRGIQGGL